MDHFHLYTGNNLELLADRMMHTVGATAPDGLFTPERFVVQSRGMERWLSQYIARRRGICANVCFDYPDMFLQSLYRSIPGLQAYNQEESGWSRGTLAWIIMRVLPGLLDDKRFRIVRTYLQMEETGALDEQKLFQLSVRIADVFDQYMIFRPDTVRAWERAVPEEDEDAAWQAVLWRTVSEDDFGGILHRARIQQELVAYLSAANDAPPSFPKRVTVFGISYLPQYYIDVLLALSKHVDVHYFTINPSAEYWSDVVTPRRQRTLSAANQDVYVGNILLASLGVEGRDFHEMLLERDLYAAESDFEEPPCDSLLHCIQNDIFHYRDANSDPSRSHPPVDENDRSIVVENCHSRLREMEVLHDHLIALFESDHTLEPSDVLVMAPAIEEYAPYVEAVFNAGGPQKLPFSIADRPVKSEYKITQAFLALLHFNRARFAASSVMELLEYEHITAKFGMTQSEIESVKTWIRDARIRWGLDKRDIEEQYELPIDEVNTWRYGLNRMLLGYAFPSNSATRMFGGILPFDNIEGADAVTFGKLLAFFTTLAEIEAALRSKHALAEWTVILRQAADRFFAMEYEDSSVITPAIGALAILQDRSGYEDAVDIHTVISVLNGSFTQEGRAQRFLRGGVTFCSLLPMRSIPARVICLVGMNNGEFPRRTQNLGFDAMVKKPRRGDRSKRNDDRYMFLESILSAKDRLYISYCGQNQRDNAVIPPSVAVSELLDYVENNFPDFDPRVRKDAARTLATDHKLQAFNPIYFSGDRKYFSYSKKYARAATTTFRGVTQTHPFITGALPVPALDALGAELSEFIRFFHNPSEYFLKRRLSVTLLRRDETIEDSELFAMGALDAYALKQHLLALQLERGSIRGEYERVAASGVLPHGAAGSIAFEDLCGDVELFAGSIAARMRQKKLDDLPVDLPLDGLRLTGAIGNIYADALLFYRMASMKPKDYISAWITHLALAALGAPGYPETTVCCSFSKTTMATEEFPPVTDPKTVMNRLAALYRKGLETPLKFFPDASMRCADALRLGKSEAAALDAARKAWSDSFTGAQAEAENPYIRQCFMDRDPFDEEFIATALEVYRPMSEHAAAAGGDQEGGQ